MSNRLLSTGNPPAPGITVYGLVQRHFRHQGNILLLEEKQRARAIGAKLSAACKSLGIPMPSGWYSSPEARAIESGLCTLQGAGTMIPLRGTHAWFGAFTTTGGTTFSPKDVEAITEWGKLNDMRTIESSVVACNIAEIAEKLEKRALEGALAFRDAVVATVERMEQVFLLESHGAKIEPAIAHLQGASVHRPEFMMREGDFALLKFHTTAEDGYVELVNAQYLGDLSEYEQAK